MRSIVSRHRNTRSPLYLALLSVLSAAAGCSLPDAASPEMLAGSAKTSIALDMQVVSILANAVNARVTYARTVAPLDSVMIDSTVSFKRSSTGDANWQGNRGFPVEVDLARCLLDKNHKVGGTGGCRLKIVVRLLDNGREVDRVNIAEFTVEPGRINVIPQVIVLREVGSVDVGSPVQLLRVGEGGGLSVRLTDVEGNPVTGRDVAWSSSDASVARVSADGNVMGVAPGHATFTARVGTREGSVTLTVSPN